MNYTMVKAIGEKYVWDGSSWFKVLKRKLKLVDGKEVMKFISSNFSVILENEQLSDLKNELVSYYNECAQNELDAGDYENEVDFVKKKNEELDLFDVKASAILINKNGRTKIYERLKLEAADYNRSIGNEFLKTGLIKDALAVVADEIRLTKLNEFTKSVAYDKSVKPDWESLLDAMRVTENRESHLKAFKHIIWQVKRKLNCLPVKWHLAFILYGKQGCGKTEFLKKFFSVIDDLYLDMDGEDISDSFSAHNFENHFVGNLDELSKLNSSSLEMLKAFITRETSTQRMMFSQVIDQFKQNLTIVGSTNRPINKVIIDFSGNRRWWETPVDKGFKTMNFDWIEGADFMPYWKAINENGPGFYSANDAEMVAYQETFRSISPAEEFIGTHGYECNYKEDTQYVELSKLWEEWKDWTKRHNYKPYTINSFRGSLIEFGFELIKKRVDTKNRWFVKISSWCEEF